MNLLEKLYRADESRISRFHTVTGTLCLNPADMAVALGSTMMRLTTGKLLDLPWVTFPAIRFLETLPRDMDVFEYGCGMSTGWYARHYKEVHAVENNPDWFARAKNMTQSLSNVSIVLRESETTYVQSIEQAVPAEFDLVVIDGAWRRQCVPHALGRLKRGGYIMLDNSDVFIEARDAISSTFSDKAQKFIFSGFVPGAFHVNETTVWKVE